MPTTAVTATIHRTCPECGQAPMGAACYHICSNSDHFYSPEQERYDDQFYGCDRYDGFDDPDLYAEGLRECDIADQDELDAERAAELARIVAVFENAPSSRDDGDLPF